MLGNALFDHYQMAHFLGGFMGEPGGQWKAVENSAVFERVPMTRYSLGVWGSLRSWSLSASGVFTEHHTCAKPMKKSWLEV